MAAISYIFPTDQPTGNRRLLDELLKALDGDEFHTFICCVAFAKLKPLLKMAPSINAWNSRGNRIIGIFGIDHLGTSHQAIEFGLKNFRRLYLTHYPYSTFHPKIYMFLGRNSARLYIGSQNLTVGGTETNFEAATRLDFKLPEEREFVVESSRSWLRLLPSSCESTYRATDEILKAHIEDNILLDEVNASRQHARRQHMKPGEGESSSPRKFYREGFPFRPPKPLPKPKGTIRERDDGAATPTVENPSKAATGLAIQIKPHHNGEIFLSKTAVNQNPEFFGFPFTGSTSPKKEINRAYPQRTPDPIVDIAVIGGEGNVIQRLSAYDLNTVYYEPKSEIRITASPLVELVPEYSVMVIKESEDPSLDYDVIIHTPSSPDYQIWLDLCNQTMPSGGKEPRRFGWF